MKMRKIKVYRNHSELLKDSVLGVLVDGEKLLLIKDGEEINFELSVNGHILSIQKSEKYKNFKAYMLHVPFGEDDYSFEISVKDNVIEFV